MNQCRQEVDAEAALLGDQLTRSRAGRRRGRCATCSTAMQRARRPEDAHPDVGRIRPDRRRLTSELGGAGGGDADEHLRVEAGRPAVRDHATPRAPVNEPLNDLRADGLETLAAAARGALFNVNGTGSQLFEQHRVRAVGLLPARRRVRSGRSRSASRTRFEIDVSRRGATVRTRRQLLNVPADINGRSNAREAITAALTAPLLMSALPLRVATFALRGPEAGQGAAADSCRRRRPTTPDRRPGVIGYVIRIATARASSSRPVNADADAGDERRAGRAAIRRRREPRSRRVHHQAGGGRRRPHRQRRASVHAVLSEAGGKVKLSELMVGGPVGYRATWCGRRSATPSASAPCTDTSKPTVTGLDQVAGEVRDRRHAGWPGAAQRRRCAPRRRRRSDRCSRRSCRSPSCRPASTCCARSRRRRAASRSRR